MKILGTGRALPEGVLTNSDLEKMVDTSDEWIITRTGIRERRILRPDEKLFTLALKAAQDALEDAGTSPDELSLIICSTLGGADVVPPLACQVMSALGCNCPSFDVNAACSGFLYSLSIAKSMSLGKTLIISAEQLSKVTDYDDRRTCILFGDAAGAAVVTPADNIQYINIRGAADPNASMTCPGINHRDENGQIAPGYMLMDGQEVFKFATREMMRLIKNGLEATGLTTEDIRYVIPHQANIRILRSCAERSGFPMEKIYVNIDRLGNTSSATIPVALDELRKSGELAPGDLIMLAGFGAGWTSGCAVIRL